MYLWRVGQERQIREQQHPQRSLASDKLSRMYVTPSLLWTESSLIQLKGYFEGWATAARKMCFKHFQCTLVPGGWITPVDHCCCEILTSSQLFPAFQCKHLVHCLLVEMLKHKSSYSIIILWCFRHCQYLKQYLEVCLSCRMLLVSCIISFLGVLYNIASSSLFHSNTASFAATRSWNAPAISLQPRQPGSLDTKV